MAEPDASSIPEAFGLEREGDEWLAELRRARESRPLGAIGGYELLEELGRGGQGVVYLALAPDGARVALKRLILGAGASDSAKRRLARELRAAASLDHPGLVRVLGLEEIAGQPVLVMEWIDGIPVTRWSARPGRSLEEVLALFEGIVEAVEHAHARNVLHRDLKPSNVLVDRAGKARILDFGLAKLLDESGGDESQLTRSTAFLGTLAHAAPEQVHGPAERVDVRADVYALGALLYEMLTGETPYPRARTLAEALAGFERHEPARPSTFDARVGAELDALVLQAVRADRERRYPSTALLLADLRRLRRGEPVRARAPGPWYELRRFSRRHPVPVAVALALVTAATGWSVYAGVQGRRLAAQRDEARLAREVARTQAAMREEVLGFFLDDLLRGVSPRGGSGELTITDLLDQAGARVGERFRSRPLVEAAVRDALGGAYAAGGDALAAEAQLALALELAAAEPDAAPLDLARYRRARGRALLELQRAGEAAGEARAALEALRAAAPASAHELASALALVAQIELWFGREREALASCEEGLRLLGSEADATPAGRALLLELLAARAGARLGLGELAAAESALEEALELALLDHAEDHPVRGELVFLLGELRLLERRFAEAAEAFRHVDHVRARAFGESDPRRAAALEGLGRAHLGLGEPERSLAFCSAARELLESHGSWSHRVHVRAERTEAFALAALGRRREASRRMEEAVRGARALLGAEHPEVRRDLELAASLSAAGDGERGGEGNGR